MEQDRNHLRIFRNGRLYMEHNVYVCQQMEIVYLAVADAAANLMW